VARAIKIYIRGIRPGRIVNSNGRVIGSIVKKRKKKKKKKKKKEERKKGGRRNGIPGWKRERERERGGGGGERDGK